MVNRRARRDNRGTFPNWSGGNQYRRRVPIRGARNRPSARDDIADIQIAQARSKIGHRAVAGDAH
jgi:hypothetical protein